MKKEKINKRYGRYRKYGYPIIAVFLYLLFSLINPIEEYAAWYGKYQITDYLTEFSYLILLTADTIESGIITSIILDKYIVWEFNAIKRFSLQLVFQMLFLAGSYPLFLIISNYINSNFISLSDSLLIRQAAVLGVLVSIIITAFFTAEHFLLNWNKTKLQAALLEKKALEIELSALRTQIDPHFLFNNFSALTALIEEDKLAALEYLEKLTSVYRYLLMFRNKHLVSLNDELSFINSYLYLYQVRYGKNLKVEISTPLEVSEKKLPPLTLQLLIENAVKHNSISTSEPLQIKIYCAGVEELIIENNINPRSTPEKSTGLGLNNINQRYKLLGYPNGIAINHTEQVFIVKIPLIDYEN